MTHASVPRRRRSGQTDYGARTKAVRSGGILLVARVSGKNVSAQFVKPGTKGDRVLSSSHSRELRKHGWKGSLKSTPACYLLGLLAGKKAKDEGVANAFLYNGVAPFVKGSRVSAFVKGVVDAGLPVPISAEVFPDDERLSGGSIAAFAAKLAKENKDLYQKRFSSILKQGLKPEEYSAHVSQVRERLKGGPA